MVYILLGEGFEEAEALVTADVLRRGGVEAALTGIGGMTVSGRSLAVSACFAFFFLFFPVFSCSEAATDVSWSFFSAGSSFCIS